jgi:hypothetical protein
MKTPSEKDITLVEKCTHYFSQMLVQAEVDGLLNQEEVLVIRQGVEQVEKQIQKYKQFFEKASNHITGSYGKENLVLEAAYKIFAPKLPKYQAPGGKTAAYIFGALLPECELSDVTQIVPFLEQTISWAERQNKLGNEEEVHFELGRMSHIIQSAFQEKAREMASIDEHTRKVLIKQLYTLGSIYVQTLITVSKRKGNPVCTHELMFKTLIDLVAAARIAGGGSELIKRYPISLDGISREFNDFYHRFESYSDEKRAKDCLESSKK